MNADPSLYARARARLCWEQFLDRTRELMVQPLFFAELDAANGKAYRKAT
jgi:hypothetical protein